MSPKSFFTWSAIYFFVFGAVYHTQRLKHGSEAAAFGAAFVTSIGFLVFCFGCWAVYKLCKLSFRKAGESLKALPSKVSSVKADLASNSVSNASTVTVDLMSNLVSKVSSVGINLASSFEINPEYFGQAEQEINEGNIDKGLWAKALVNVNGNEVQRKAEYIKLRAKQLQIEFKKELNKNRAEEKQKAWQKRVEEEQKAHEARLRSEEEKKKTRAEEEQKIRQRAEEIEVAVMKAGGMSIGEIVCLAFYIGVAIFLAVAVFRGILL